jgi:hypothetical protein
MGLEGLAARSRNLAQYVKTLSLVGSWRELDTEDFAKGRIPDNTMIMNVAVRAAIENTEKLQQFRWAVLIRLDSTETNMNLCPAGSLTASP